jgi:hypothetical protein
VILNGKKGRRYAERTPGKGINREKNTDSEKQKQDENKDAEKKFAEAWK